MGTRQWNSAVLGLDAWAQFSAPVLVSAGLGWLLDRKLGLDPPWCTFAGVLLGLAAGMKAIVSLADQMERADADSLYPLEVKGDDSSADDRED